jgi:hypothetical protein
MMGSAEESEVHPRRCGGQFREIVLQACGLQGDQRAAGRGGDVLEGVGGAAGREDKGAWTHCELAPSYLKLVLAFEDVERLVFAAMSVQRWPSLRRNQTLHSGVTASGIRAYELDRDPGSEDKGAGVRPATPRGSERKAMLYA